MSIITVQELERDIRDFVRRLEAGESFVVVKDQHPLAEVRPLPLPAIESRPYGLCAGQFTVGRDFDEALPEEVLGKFEGR